MEISNFLASFWGYFLAILALIFLLGDKKLLEELLKSVNDKIFKLLIGFIALTFGLLTVISHNIWVADWRAVITIFGWLSLAKGVMLLAFPEFLDQQIVILKDHIVVTKILLFICVLIGGWLVWIGN